MTTSAALFNPSTQPGLFAQAAPLGSTGGAVSGSTSGMGAISGGLLRPGSIDQATFQQMLQQQQQNRQAAGVGGRPVQMPIQNFQPAIPTLSSAQFAALVGAQEEAATPTADSQAVAQQAAAAQRVAPVAARAAAAPTLRLSGSPQRTAAPSAQAGGKPAGDAETEADADAPTISRRSQPEQVAAVAPPAAGDDVPQITRKSTQTAAAAPEAAAEQTTDNESKTASKGDPDVVHLKSPPDKDQQKELRMQHKRWVVDETPGARQLFFGPDGEFGWDDFLDMINPLQHIPGIAQIYRAVTGDESYGAANLLGALPFGPLGGPAMIASIADLAVKDVSGSDIGDNLTAMVFGKSNTPAEGGATAAPADMAEAGDGNTGVRVQTASRDPQYTFSEASQQHESCRG
jgi:hypothetical protein